MPDEGHGPLAWGMSPVLGEGHGPLAWGMSPIPDEGHGHERGLKSSSRRPKYTDQAAKPKPLWTKPAD